MTTSTNLGCLQDIGGWFLKIWNEFIQPTINTLQEEVRSLWDEHLQPLWEKILGFISSITKFFLAFWNNVLKPIIDWIIKYILPVILPILQAIIKIVKEVFGIIADVSGGFYTEISCFGKSEEKISFQTSPTSQKIQQVYNKLQDAIAEATELLNGANGGIFEVTDADGDGVNDGWIIHSADGQKFIKANINGIGITQNGGATYQTAMTAEGINADTITTGAMNAQRISVGDASLGDVFEVNTDNNNRIVVKIGSSASDIHQEQTNDAIKFVDGANNDVAEFSTTGARWADMQEMAYCGFVWTKSAVSGNVRFTIAGSDK